MAYPKHYANYGGLFIIKCKCRFRLQDFFSQSNPRVALYANYFMSLHRGSWSNFVKYVCVLFMTFDPHFPSDVCLLSIVEFEEKRKIKDWRAPL